MINIKMYNKESIPVSEYCLVDDIHFETSDHVLNYLLSVIEEGSTKYFKIKSKAGTRETYVMISQINTINIE